jgi:nicotinic acid mononucleotide adenylyltransferase
VNQYNILVEKYLNQYNTNAVNRKIGIFAGSFKPCHKGHFTIAEMASENNDSVFIIISPTEREGITAKQSLAIWKLYATVIPSLKILIAKISPVRSAYELVDRINQDPAAPNTIISIYCDRDDMSRFNRLKEFTTNLKSLKKVVTPRICSASKIRADLVKGNKAAVFKNLPKQVNKEEIWKILTKPRIV